MKKYYLHSGTESSGPFTIEELKAKNITKASPVWFEGMLHWKTAGEIPELTSLFMVTPPPIAPFLFPPSPLKVEEKREPRKIMGMSKSNFFTALGFLLLVVGSFAFNSYQEMRNRELAAKNHKTEVENYQLELKQKEAEDEKIQAVIQERIEAQRVSAEKKQTYQNRILKIELLLVDYQTSIVETEKKLNEASDFQLLRSVSEKREQMDLLQKKISSLKSEMSKLRMESDQLKLELEKIPK
ncbi:MAG: DUF4339 domain-containing protein [Flavobacterium sp.]|nr:DUF4339 domain-containing protein [Flavobacterium sp.]